MVGTAPDRASVVAKWGGVGKRPPSPEPFEALASSMKEEMRVDPKYISTPQPVQFPTAGGAAKAYGYFYPPKNGDYSSG